MGVERGKGDLFGWPFIIAALVLAIFFVAILTVGLYLRSMVVGPPVKVMTYTEYRQSSYFPSATLFYLTTPIKNWKALNQIATQPFEEPWLLSREDFVNKFSSEGIDLSEFNEQMSAIEKHTQKEKHSYIIRDKRGLIISLGLPKKHLNLAKWIAFPEKYPYNCQSSEMPVFSKKKKDMRIKFVFCCKGIIECEDYLTGPGRDECISDPCGVGPCKFYYCKRGLFESNEPEICLGKKKGTRVCIYNEPPKLNLFAKFKEDTKYVKTIEKTFPNRNVYVNFKLEVEKDFSVSNISKVILDFGDETSNVFVPKEKPPDLKQEWQRTKVIFWFNHTYKKPGEYKVSCVVRDEDKNEGKDEVKIILKED